MKILLHFDGMCEPKNPGGVAVAAWMAFDYEANPEVLDGDFLQVMNLPVLAGGRVVADGGERATNNVAEWCALGGGLRAILDGPDPCEHLIIRGDSQLVINQLTGKFAVRAAHLKPLRDRCWEILEAMGCQWQAEWIPRERNEIVDAHGRRIFKHYQGKKKAVRR